MARPDWGSLQEQFLSDHAQSSISPKDWCEAKGLNYSSGKRYIKIANAQKTAKHKGANSHKEESKSHIKKNGRPSDYLPEVAEDICKLLSGGESLRKVCERQGMPSRTTVFRWLAEHEEFRNQYATATETRADAIFEDMFDIADKVNEESAAVAKARLRIDTRKWALARMNPKKYGDKVTQDIDVKSSDGSMTPKPTMIQLVAPGVKNDDSAD